jgi:hypothetical protein
MATLAISEYSLALPDCQLLLTATQVKVKVKVTLRLTVSQSVSGGVEPHLGLMTRYLLLSDYLIYCEL